MNEKLLDATLKVIIDAQAYLHAALQSEVARLNGNEITADQFQNFMDDFKLETARLIEAAYEGKEI